MFSLSWFVVGDSDDDDDDDTEWRQVLPSAEVTYEFLFFFILRFSK